MDEYLPLRRLSILGIFAIFADDSLRSRSELPAIHPLAPEMIIIESWEACNSCCIKDPPQVQPVGGSSFGVFALNFVGSIR